MRRRGFGKACLGQYDEQRTESQGGLQTGRYLSDGPVRNGLPALQARPGLG
jgi:hypothetical protein